MRGLVKLHQAQNCDDYLPWRLCKGNIIDNTKPETTLGFYHSARITPMERILRRQRTAYL